MDQKGLSEEENSSFYPMFLGVSYAFSALKLMPEPESSDEKWLEVRNRMLQVSAQILALLVWRVQKEEAMNEKSNLLFKLENANREIIELKLRRSEDAKANEKVVGIFAEQEQGWFDERKMLRQQIKALKNELTLLKEKNQNLQEKIVSLQARDTEESQERREIQEKLIEDLKCSSKREAQLYSNEIAKHKSVFTELKANQHQLEAEMDRALAQLKAAKQELGLALIEKEQAVFMTQRLSMELIKMRKDLEQKDMMEVKLSKVKRKQPRLKEEKLEAFNGRLLSMETELKRLQVHIKSLNQNMARLREDNMKLEALLLDREEELTTLRETFLSHLASLNCQTTKLSPCMHDPTIIPELIWQKIKIGIRKLGPKEQETKTLAERICQDKEKSKEAFEVSCKIKRLKEQLDILDMVRGKRENINDNEVVGINGLFALFPLLNKQIGQYETLQEKINDLCNQMKFHDLDFNNTSSENARTGEETKMVEHFLQQTFQLQRYVVATGQMLIKLQAKIGSDLVGTVIKLARPVNSDVKQFADGFSTYFREVQRGLEVQIGRIMGELERTFAL